MIGLVRLELTRLRWRRAVLLLVIAAVAIPALIFASSAYNTRPLSDADIERARVVAGGAYVDREIRQCEANPPSRGITDPEACESKVMGQYIGRNAIRLRDDLQGTLPGIVAIVVAAMLLVGATYAGHDWSSGSMSNQLLVEPRRARVWLAKAVAVTATAFVVSLLVLLAFWYGLVGLSSLRGLNWGPDVVGNGLELCLRSAGLTAGAAFGSYALTMLFRSTVATLGVVFAMVILGSFLMAALVEDSARYQFQNNALAVVTNRVEIYDPNARCASGQEFGSVYGCGYVQLDAVDGALYLGSLTLLAGGASLLSFRRRDVP